MESTPSQARPLRRRRRWLVTFALVFVGLATWWYWPRGDARFVGRWALSRTSQGRPLHVWKASRNGGSWLQQLSSGQFTYLNWSVDGDKLSLGYRWYKVDGALFRFFQFLQAKTGWHPWVVAGDDWEIREVTPDSILLWPSGATESYTLTRLPD